MTSDLLPRTGDDDETALLRLASLGLARLNEYEVSTGELTDAVTLLRDARADTNSSADRGDLRRAFALVVRLARTQVDDAGADEGDLYADVARARQVYVPAPTERTELERAARWRQYELETFLREHQYDIRHKGTQPDNPGWHVCRCWQWEGYWFEWHSHVADYLNDTLARLAERP